MNIRGEQLLRELFHSWKGEDVSLLDSLPPSGSYREYCRITASDGSKIIGAWNTDVRENKAFLCFSDHFASLGLPVPAVLARHSSGMAYLLEDLGDETLLEYCTRRDFHRELTVEVKDMYRKVLSVLPAFQVRGGSGLDYHNAYPRAAFDRQSMMWDLNYFKYYFLKLARVPFDEQGLETDFKTLCDFLLEADSGYFLYRDFQSRNVMIHGGEPYFIDYQGGRMGALQYDVASILFEAKTNLAPEFRQELLETYLEALQSYAPVSREVFMQHYYGFVYIRTMQAMGAYGFRGLYEKKPLFLQSIPMAVQTLGWLDEHVTLPVSLPALSAAWRYLARSPRIARLASEAAASAVVTVPGSEASADFRTSGSVSAGTNQEPLTVSVWSFSYRKGIPEDTSGNGGGFVFDCRSVNNPGRVEAFRNLTGKDAAVKHMLFGDDGMKLFLEHVTSLVEASVANYLERGFTHLHIAFGCTGGQHRSVYAAERLYQHLHRREGLRVELHHRDMPRQDVS